MQLKVLSLRNFCSFFEAFVLFVTKKGRSRWGRALGATGAADAHVNIINVHSITPSSTSISHPPFLPENDLARFVRSLLIILHHGATGVLKQTSFGRLPVLYPLLSSWLVLAL